MDWQPIETAPKGDNLLPCPFCGSSDTFVVGLEHPTHGEYWVAGCNNEDCPTDTDRAKVDGKTREDAVRLWNTRLGVEAATAKLRAEVDVLKSENEMLREALKEADSEMDWLDEDMDTCDHSVGVCMCSYWSVRRKMKAALAQEGGQ